MTQIVKPNFVPGKGPNKARLAFIGEAPGYDENIKREPFVGASGRLLQNMCAKAGIKWEETYRTNVIKYRPPGNNFFRHKEVGVDLQESIEALQQEINAINPNVCVIFGNNALNSLLHLQPIRHWRGSILLGMGRKCIPTIHPAHILHQKEGEAFKYWMKYIIEFDLARAKKQSEFKAYEPPKRILEVCKSSSQLLSFRRRFPKAEYLSIDIEGYGKKGGGTRIPSCVGLSYSPQYAISVPLYHVYPGSEAPTGISEYDTPEIWRLLATFLREEGIKKIGQNFKYDQDKLDHLGMPIDTLYADTMIAQHTLFPEMWQGLDFQTSIWTEEPYYKDEGSTFDPTRSRLEQLYKYNARDAAVTLEVFLAQLGELAERGLDKWFFSFRMKLHDLYLGLERAGFCPNEEVRLELIKKYIEWESKVHYRTWQLLGYELNVSSNTVQVPKAIYEDLGMPIRKGRGRGSKTGKGATDERTITRLLNNHAKDDRSREVLNNILLERQIRKTLGPQYLSALPDYDGKMKTTVFITGTETNRTSNKLLSPPVRPEKIGMSFSTLTKHGDVGHDLRLFLEPRPGFILCNIDSTQAEARVVALLADDEDTLSMMNEIDVHALTASWSFGGTWQSHSKKENGGKETPARFIGKTGRHAADLGVGKAEFAAMVNTRARKYHIDIVTYSEYKANIFLNTFHKNCPNIQGVFHAGIEECLAKDRRILRGAVPYGFEVDNPASRQFFERWGRSLFKEGYAYIPQQSVSDNTKAAMLRTKKILPDIHFIVEAHDSMTFEAPLGEYDDWIKIGVEEMERPISFAKCSLKRRDLVIPAEAEIGDNYKEMGEYVLNS